MDFKDRMIEAYERGECSYEGAYDYVRDSLADAADLERDRRDYSSHPVVGEREAAQSVSDNGRAPRQPS